MRPGNPAAIEQDSITMRVSYVFRGVLGFCDDMEWACFSEFWDHATQPDMYNVWGHFLPPGTAWAVLEELGGVKRVYSRAIALQTNEAR